MYVNENRAFDALIDLADNVNRTPDIAARLSTLVRINEEWKRVIIPARDKAAYEARQKYALEDLVTLTGHSQTAITYWMMQHRHRTGAPKIGRHQRIDLSGAIDLSHRPVGVEQPPAVE